MSLIKLESFDTCATVAPLILKTVLNDNVGTIMDEFMAQIITLAVSLPLAVSAQGLS